MYIILKQSVIIEDFVYWYIHFCSFPPRLGLVPVFFFNNFNLISTLFPVLRHNVIIWKLCCTSLTDSHLVAYSYYACLGFLNILLDIVMCAGSSKSLEIYDMNVGKCARTITDVHTRPVHCIKQHEVLFSLLDSLSLTLIKGIV